MAHLSTVLFGTAHVERSKVVWRMPLRSSLVIVILLIAFFATGNQVSAIPVVIGALFAAVADVGEHVGHRWRTMLWTTAWLMVASALGDLVSDWAVLVVIASCAFAAVCGFVGAIGMRASLIGTLALVVLTVFAGTPQIPWEAIPNALLIGLGGVVQTAVTCLPPLIRNPSLIHKPQDDGNVLVRLRTHLHATDPFLRHAVRLALAIGIATILSLMWHREHAYWIPMTVAWVAKPDKDGTATRVVARIGGTLLGLIVVGLAVDQLGIKDAGIIITVGVGSMLALSFIWANYAIAVAGVTILVIALFSPAFAGDARPTLWDRAVDTVVAGIITVLVSFVWPAVPTPPEKPT